MLITDSFTLRASGLFDIDVKLYHKIVGLGIDDRVWDATVFAKNRDRLLAGAVTSRFLAHLVSLPAVKRLSLQDHFSVDGTQIEAWASIKSFPGR